MRFVFPLGLAVAVTTTADAHGSDVSQRARLVYALDALALPDCPDATAVRKAVGERLGYDPFWEWAPQTIVLQVGRDRGQYFARVVKVDPEGRSVTRAIPPDADCHQVVAAAALAISIALDLAPAPTAAVVEPESSPSALTPASQPPAAPTLLPQAAPAEARGSSAPPLRTPRLAFGAGVSAFSGIIPAPGASAFAFAEFRRRTMSIGGELQVSTAIASPQFRGGWGAAALVPCARFGATSLCALGEIGWVQVWSTGAKSSGSDGAPFVALGGRARLDVPFSAQAFVRLQGDFLIEAYGPRLVVADDAYVADGRTYRAPQVSLSSWIGGALGLGVGAHSPVTDSLASTQSVGNGKDHECHDRSRAQMIESPQLCAGGGRGLARSALSLCRALLGVILATGCKGKTIALDPTVFASRAIVTADPDSEAGVNGQFEEVMATAFTSAVWQYGFFDAHPEEQNPDASALIALASALPPPRVLVQMYDAPLRGESPETAYWDFSELDAIVQPLLTMGAAPLIQIYNTPPWIDPSTSTGAVDFADYCASIVSYYNGKGVPMDGGVAQSRSGKPVTWWAVLGDPNTGNAISIDGGTPYSGTTYAAVYNMAVSRMSQVDSTIKFVAPEYNDCINDPTGANPAGPCAPNTFVHDFLGATTNGGDDGGAAPIGALSVHMFSTNYAIRKDAGVTLEPDSVAFQTVIPKFTGDVAAFREQLREEGRPKTQVWVTQNQVNSDFPLVDGGSGNYYYNSGRSTYRPFEADARGTDVFFAAWRPYLFSQLGKAGVSALFQWQYTAGRCPNADAGCSVLDASDTDIQNAEVNYVSDTKHLSYWVDYTLARKFVPGQDILKVTAPAAAASNSNIELLATRRIAGDEETVVVMVVNASVQNEADIDGPGAPAAPSS